MILSKHVSCPFTSDCTISKKILGYENFSKKSEVIDKNRHVARIINLSECQVFLHYLECLTAVHKCTAYSILNMDHSGPSH
jgi:hypothetical protein